MAMLAQGPYAAKEFPLSGLTGISDQTLQIHFALYQGYVKNTNALTDQLAALHKDGKTAGLDYAELTRRLGFEYNGMILHEHHFGALKAGGVPLDPKSALAAAMNAKWGSFEGWQADFRAVAQMRGIGWAVLFQNPANGWLCNQWITLHQDGSPAGFQPILVLDVWEHAFLLDYKPAERPKYIDAFLQNVNWPVLEKLLK